MLKDIRFLLFFLIVAIAILVYLQSQNCNAIPNSGSLSIANAQHFTTNNESLNTSHEINNKIDTRLLNNNISNKHKKSQIVDDMLNNNNNNNNNNEYDLDTLINYDDESNLSNMF